MNKPQCVTTLTRASCSRDDAASRFPGGRERERVVPACRVWLGAAIASAPDRPGRTVPLPAPRAFLLWAVRAGEELKLACSSALHSSTMTGLQQTRERHSAQTQARTPGSLSHT